MSEVLVVELKSDLESVYKIGGDLLNFLEDKDFKSKNTETRELIGLIKFRLEDMCGTLQKDIFNCDYLMTKFKTSEDTHLPGQLNWREENGRQ
jgi:hypothetical protein